jgi:hypothetical protein
MCENVYRSFGLFDHFCLFRNTKNFRRLLLSIIITLCRSRSLTIALRGGGRRGRRRGGLARLASMATLMLLMLVTPFLVIVIPDKGVDAALRMLVRLNETGQHIYGSFLPPRAHPAIVIAESGYGFGSVAVETVQKIHYFALRRLRTQKIKTISKLIITVFIGVNTYTYIHTHTHIYIYIYIYMCICIVYE